MGIIRRVSRKNKSCSCLFSIYVVKWGVPVLILAASFKRRNNLYCF